METSAKEDSNIDKVFESLTNQVLERIKLDEKNNPKDPMTTLSGKKEEKKKD